MITEKDLPNNIELIVLTDKPMDKIQCVCNEEMLVFATQAAWSNDRFQFAIKNFIENHKNCK